MASPTSTAPPPLTSSSTPSGSRSAWPTDWRWRGLIALAFALPYVVIAVRVYGSGYRDTANTTLDQQSALIHWGSSDLSFLPHVYPPLPTAVAALLPNAMALGIVGALAAGGMLQTLTARLVQHGYPVPAALLLAVALAGSPSFALTATTDLASFMGLAFLVFSLDGFIRFVFRGQTHGGFQAGLAIGAAGLCIPSATICALGFAAAAPLLARHRYRGQKAGRATACVLLFPTVAGILGWIFLCWRFAGSPLGWLRQAAPGLWGGAGSLDHLHTALTTVGLPLLLTPVFLTAVVLLALRRRALQALGICLPLACIIVALWLGLPFPATAVAVILGVVGLVALPVRPSRRLLTIILLIALAGLAAKWTYPASTALQNWEHALRIG
jgi:hypothetical protein